MRKTRTVLHVAISIFLIFWGDVIQAQARLVERSIQTPDGQRRFLEFVPGSAGRGAPLVVLLHGGRQSMTEVFGRNAVGSRRWLTLARSEGFVLVAPNGTNERTASPTGTNQVWNDYRTTGLTDRIDDVAFIVALVDRMERDHGIDRRRVYVTGASNGGMMTFRLLAERPDVFAAGAAFIANLPAETATAPAGPVPIFIALGTDDPLMPFAGGRIGRDRGSLLSSDRTLSYWLRANGLARSDGRATRLPDTDPTDGCRIMRTDWGPSGAPTITYVEMVGGGHTMPVRGGRQLPRIVERLVGRVCGDINGADEAWNFLRRHRR